MLSSSSIFIPPLSLHQAIWFHCPLFFVGRSLIEDRARQLTKQKKTRVSKVDWREKCLLVFVKFSECLPMLWSLAVKSSEGFATSHQAHFNNDDTSRNSSLSTKIPWSSFLLGSAITELGFVIFDGAHKALGENYSITLEIHENHVLRCPKMRHPMYLGMMVMGLGRMIALCPFTKLHDGRNNNNRDDGMKTILQHLAISGSYLLSVIILTASRINLEEEMLIEHFHYDYREYKKRSWTLIPGIW